MKASDVLTVEQWKDPKVKAAYRKMLDRFMPRGIARLDGSSDIRKTELTVRQSQRVSADS